LSYDIDSKRNQSTSGEAAFFARAVNAQRDLREFRPAKL
jgi:hypothetical protein